MHILSWLFYGVLLTLPLLFLAEKYGQKFTIKLLGKSLIIAAIIYVVFAAIWGNQTWIMIELAGVVLYGAFYWAARKTTLLLLPLGWLLHPVWDIAVHYQGPGTDIAPHWYTIACLSFDVIVASYLFTKISQWRKTS